MARYFFHLRDGSDEIVDPEGREFGSLEEMRSAVLTACRDLMSGDIKGGVLDLRFRIDAEDGEGTVIYSLPFEHAFSLIPRGDPRR